jgi:cell division protein FtsB
MSAVSVLAPLPSNPRRSHNAPALTLVVATRAHRRARPRVFYALVAVIGVFAILLTQLLLSILLSDGAYRISALQSQTGELERDAQVLVESLDTLRSPQYLAANAESLGMVSNANPAYLRLADATVLGAPIAAGTGAGVLNGGDTMIGNVLLADMALVTPIPEGGVSGVAPAPTVSGSLASLAGAPAGALPSPVTR